MNALEEPEVDRLTKIREKLARKVTELNIVASNPGRRSLISARTVRTEDSYSHKRISDLATFQDIGDALIPGVRLDTLSESENAVLLFERKIDGRSMKSISLRKFADSGEEA